MSNCNCDGCVERRGAMEREAFVADLVGDVMSGLSVLQTRGFAVDDETIRERAANIVQAIIGNYTVTR